MVKLPSTFRGFLSGPQNWLEGFFRIGFPIFCIASSEVAVTSAPVSSLNGMTFLLMVTSAVQIVVDAAD